jgi:hypothetical protein
MSLKSITCLDCSETIGYFDNFGVPMQSFVGGFVCKRCQKTHKPLTSQHISPNVIQALNKKSRATDW